LRVLSKHGFHADRQSGSHIHMIHPDGRFVTIPRHDPIKEGTLKSILFQANISKTQFLKEI
jgi:predicted RNA binding protein YcfA (HicA-like mRNA interferase family)